MWDVVFLIGLVLLVVGIVKRQTRWGKGAAIIGAVGVAASLIVAGPEMLEAVQRGFQEGYEEAQNANE
jgi:hypothetical protein